MGDDTVILFGSAARGDTTKDSDIDLLVISSEGYPKSEKLGRLEVQFNTRRAMMDKSRSGDLFAVHVALEGVAVSDSTQFLKKFREALTIKRSYAEERKAAFFLAAYLMKVNSGVDRYILGKRMAWCVRTVLISQLVESGRYIFSPSGLSAAFPHLDVTPLISLRRNSESKGLEESRRSMEKFLLQAGGKSFLEIDMPELRKNIQRLGPSTALSTMKALEGKSDFDFY